MKQAIGSYFVLFVFLVVITAVVFIAFPQLDLANSLGEGLAQAGMGFDIPNPLELLVRAFNAVTDWYVVRQNSYLR
jgi:hypothetical protein